MWRSQIAGVTSVPAGSVESVDVERLGEAPPGEGHDRPQPQRLLDHRAQVGVGLTGIDLGDETLEHSRVTQQQINRPREARRGRLVAREQERQKLVTHLLIVHRAAVLEPREREQRKDVLPFWGRRISPPLGDLAEQGIVDLARQLAQLHERTGPAHAAGEEDPELETGRGGAVQQPGQQQAKPFAPLRIGHPEHRAENHLEGDRLHLPVQSEGFPERPGLDLSLRDLGDRRLVRAHALAVEWRQHQLSPLQVLGSFEQEDRARSHDRPQGKRAPRRQAVLAHRAERPNRLRVRDHDQRSLEAQEVHAERVPEAAPARLQEGNRPQEPLGGLERGGLGGSGRECSRGHVA